MKHRTSIILLFMGIAMLLAGSVLSQPPDDINIYKGNRIDTLEVLDMDEKQIQLARNEFKIAHAQVNIKESKPKPKSKTKEAKQVERDANKSAKEFRRAVRAKKSINQGASGQ